MLRPPVAAGGVVKLPMTGWLVARRSVRLWKVTR